MPTLSAERQPNGCARVCCESFHLQHTPAQYADLDFELDFFEARAVPQDERLVIAEMVIPLGDDRYTCKNWTEDGSCAIYEDRPTMCRQFPGDEPCEYCGMTSEGLASG